jgi:hypothetical protein
MQRKKSAQKKENHYLYQYRYQLPIPVPSPVPLPPSHTPIAGQRARFRDCLSKTLGGIGPVHTPVGRAAGAHTLVKAHTLPADCSAVRRGPVIPRMGGPI